MPTGIYERTKADPFDRFVEKVELVDSGCMEWTGWDNGVGYGKFFVDKTRPKVYAHRWLYEQVVGPIPEGLTIDHLCRNRGCVNPDHLEVVTQAVNIARSASQDRIAEYRLTITHCPYGHEYTPENTYRWAGRGSRQRQCKACGRARSAAYRAKSKRENPA